MIPARELLHRRYWDRVAARQKRLKIGVTSSWTVRKPPEFIDYWSEVPATLPEKMVFAGLVAREINFYFSYYIGDFPFTPDYTESYRPDFILIDYRVIIEVQGVYWHTRPGMYDHDMAKAQLYEAAGYKIYYPTDIEILSDVDAVLEGIPEVHSAAIKGNFVGIGERPFDPHAALAARVRKYPKVFVAKYRIKGRPPRDYASRFKAAKGYANKERTAVQLFKMSDFSTKYIEQLQKYGTDWVNWMKDLGVYYQDANMRLAYPTQYAYWLRWKDWWTKYSAAGAKELP